MDANKMHGEKARDGNHTRLLCQVSNESWKQHITKTAAVRPLTSHLKNQLSKMNKIYRVLLEM